MAAPDSESLSKSQTKAIEKDAKKRCKELKKAGWEPLASTTTLEYAMIKYRTYIESDEDNRVPITGIAIGRSNKIGRENAIHSGVASYAQRAKAQVVGKVKSVMSSDSHNVSQEEIDKFGAAYEAGVNTKMSGLVKEHFALVRTAKDGSKEFNVFMSIDEAKARKAREDAAREAKEKSHLGTLSEMVDEFIGEPVEADE
ncbi:hypothetical protein [Paramuribaculum intestinale]|uniref:hypothetical protein n=1 Tax=Paramuribaculum intestinale TaxID=2094151 RepID=UPI00321FEAE7